MFCFCAYWMFRFLYKMRILLHVSDFIFSHRSEVHWQWLVTDTTELTSIILLFEVVFSVPSIQCACQTQEKLFSLKKYLSGALCQFLFIFSLFHFPADL